MIKYTEKTVACPHCGHDIGLTVDKSTGSQNFYDDCPTCNHAVFLTIKIDTETNKVQLAIGDDDHSFFNNSSLPSNSL
ncbi:CPXCG motif-containing cysteine-rich protein [Vibrio hibernica]|uniref:CPXCG motif-containing cysteine-rich protein n=2 Tax=Vibrio hibernica TaxID=2587465 RepID=UPI001882E9A1|nr:CPXCG motif-containing cysteine-rich protein [Vibrio hibernica]